MTKKLDRQQILLVNMFLISVGVGLMLGAIPLSQTIWRTLLEAIGTGLIAAGGVNFIDKFFREKEKDEVTIIATQRSDVNPSIYASKYSAKKVDIFGVSVTDPLNEFLNDPDKIIDRVFSHRLRLRLVFVHPDADFIKQRAGEDHISVDELRNRQLNSIRLVIQFRQKLLEEYNVRSKKPGKMSTMGSVEVLLIDACPYLSMYRVDDKIYWGLYGSHRSGTESPVFLSEKHEETGMFDFVKEHYYTFVNDKEKFDDLHLVKMTLKDREPYLNRRLVNQLLGEEVVNTLLDEQKVPA